MFRTFTPREIVVQRRETSGMTARMKATQTRLVAMRSLACRVPSMREAMTYVPRTKRTAASVGEAPPDRAKRVLDRLQSSCSRALLYVYPDWAGEIGTLARQLGLELETPNSGTVAFWKHPAAARQAGTLNE